MLCRRWVLGLKDVLEDTIGSLRLEHKSSKMSCPQLEDSTIVWHVENGPRSWAMLFCLGTRQRTCKKKKILTIEFCGKVANLWAKTFFEIACVSQKCWAKTVYFVSWRTLPHCVFGPRPRAFPSLASDFLGVLGLEPCVLDSTFDVKLVINLANLQTC